ncbi:MAG: hypothetical protein P8H65_11750 [Rhodothermales bacterium]|nr:hypothetical protein [Rhodothermales bacterium]MDG2017161.1 hypothetical protein [Rhodothermales bacterium]
MRSVSIFLFVVVLVLTPLWASAQSVTPRGSDNMTVEGHLPLGGPESVADIELEQDMDRPYAYVARARYRDNYARGMDIIDLSDPAKPELLLRWVNENDDLNTGVGALDIKYFKYASRVYVVLSTQFGQGPDHDLGAVIFDVTGLPDASTVKEVARIREPEMPGGFHNIFIYQHSNGTPYLISTVRGPGAHMYDLSKVVTGDVANALAGNVPIPGDKNVRRAYHDFYAAWHPDSEEDRFYGGGAGGYYVYDISDIENPELRVTLTGINGVSYGHTFTPGPNGRYVIAETEYKYAPLRIFDLQPALDGERSNISQPISAWTANWENLVHNHEVRWPFVFVSGYLDGLQVFSLMDPKNPQTVGFYDTITSDTGGVMDGAFGVDVRNEDGLIVISDGTTGFWTFRMDGFNGWNGEDWGVPDISSVQKWDEESKEGTQ